MDRSKVKEMAARVVNDTGGAFAIAMAYLGDRLGLFQRLAPEAATPAQLAERTGLSKRYVREWLDAMVAAEYVEFDGERYSMTPEQTAVLADEGGRNFLGGAFQFTVAIPETPAGIHDLAANLTDEQWSDWVNALDSTEIIVHLPKFSLEQEYALKAPLEALGMIPAFCGTGADFTRMYRGVPSACISRVKHKTFVEVDEEGTEAAAVTSVEIVLTSLPPIFAVDRPFLFALRERLSGTILFLGKVVDPR